MSDLDTLHTLSEVSTLSRDMTIPPNLPQHDTRVTTSDSRLHMSTPPTDTRSNRHALHLFRAPALPAPAQNPLSFHAHACDPPHASTAYELTIYAAKRLPPPSAAPPFRPLPTQSGARTLSSLAKLETGLAGVGMPSPSEEHYHTTSEPSLYDPPLSPTPRPDVCSVEKLAFRGGAYWCWYW
ncbi:hypothetical protein D9615_002923 [Tricholomella constricta]|uniref:Uncharacterized protein n=1 Tax=Tricholomella constricta TaxID=117010 RepID=A0A8H5M6P5_9AGAR|nr:hypothetical protein D9615_002923 [Tricholomella constricta]